MRTVMRIGENSSVGVDMIAGFDVVFLNSVRNQTHSHSHSHSLQFNLMSSFFLSFSLLHSFYLLSTPPFVCVTVTATFHFISILLDSISIGPTHVIIHFIIL